MKQAQWMFATQLGNELESGKELENIRNICGSCRRRLNRFSYRSIQRNRSFWLKHWNQHDFSCLAHVWGVY